MRTSFLFFIALVCMLPGCARFQAKQTLPLHQERPPRFINIQTDGNVRSLAFEGSYLWLGTPNGLIRYDTRSPLRFQTYTVRSTLGLLAKGIFKISVDQAGVAWIGTYGGGLSRFDGKEWTTYTPYGGGKVSYGASWVIYPYGTGLGDLWVYDIFFDEGEIVWIATWKGVSRFDGNSFKTYTEKDGLLDKWVYAIAKDQEGFFWFGTEGGLNRFDGQNWTGYTHHDGLGADVGQAQDTTDNYDETENHHRRHKENRIGNPNYILDIAVDHHNIKWIGTWGAGLSRFDGKSWTTYTAGNGTIGGNYVHVLEVDSEGTLWAGTDGGVSRFDGKEWRTYTTADGLLHNDVFSIAFDPKGNKYFGTWAGLSKMVD